MERSSSLYASIDQSTTATKFAVYDLKGNEIVCCIKSHKQICPKSGWLSHDTNEIFENTLNVISDGLKELSQNDHIACIGITNQRETTVAWNKITGKPYYDAIVWCDNRTNEICQRFIEKHQGDKNFYKKINGLPISTYFSAFKIRWLIENVPEIKEDIDNVLFGTIDCWMIWMLTKNHVTDVTNASRTFLMNLRSLDWEDDLLKEFEVPRHCLPKILSSSDEFGIINLDCGLKGIPITGCLGDQQAASLGHGLVTKGGVKNTYGSGIFLMINTGEEMLEIPGLITTVAFQLGQNNRPVYALEGAIECGGCTINWMRDKLGLYKDYNEIETLINSTEDNAGVYFVPAFSGLYSPEWRNDTSGLIIGLTQFATRAHIIRACLEAICYRTRDVIECVRKNSSLELQDFKVDGGVTVNNFLMQFQADLLGINIMRSKIKNATGFGAALAAAHHAKLFKSFNDIKDFFASEDAIYHNKSKAKQYDSNYDSWKEAIKRSFSWKI